MRHAAHNWSIKVGNFGEFISIVGFGENGFREILANFVYVYIDPHGELDISDVIVAKLCMHDTGNGLVYFCILVELNALHKG